MSRAKGRRAAFRAFHVGDQVCGTDVPDLDPFTVCAVASAPYERGHIDVLELDSKRLHKRVPISHLIHV